MYDRYPQIPYSRDAPSSSFRLDPLEVHATSYFAASAKIFNFLSSKGISLSVIVSPLHKHMFRKFVCVHSNTPLLQNQELLICRRQEDAPQRETLPYICDFSRRYRVVSLGVRLFIHPGKLLFCNILLLLYYKLSHRLLQIPLLFLLYT